MNFSQQPPFSDTDASRAWFRDVYPKIRNQIAAEASSPPLEFWDCDNRADLAQRKREIARVVFDNGCKLMQEADAIERELAL